MENLQFLVWLFVGLTLFYFGLPYLLGAGMFLVGLVIFPVMWVVNKIWQEEDDNG